MTITLKHVTGASTSAAGTAIEGVKDTIISVEKGKDWVIAAKDLALPDYTLSNVFKKTSVDPAAFAASEITATFGNYGIDAVGKDEVIYVNYTAKTYSLVVKLATSTSTSTAAATTYDSNGVDKVQNATTLTTGGFAPLASTSGAPFTVTVTPAAGEIITEAGITVTNAKDVKKSTDAATGVITVTGTVDGAVVVTVTATTSYTVTAGTVKLSDTTTDAPTGAAAVTINTPVVASGANATVTVVPAAGYQVISVKNGATALTAGADNTWTLTGVGAAATINVILGYTVGGSDIQTRRIATLTGTDFDNAVKALGPGLWQIETSTGYWANKTTGTDKRDDDEIVIGLTTVGANVSAVLTITDSTGTVKGTESATFATEGAHFFNVQILDGNHESNSGSSVNPALTPGTYTVTLVVGGSTTTYTFTVGPVNP